MAESHVTFALKRRRKEITADIRKLAKDLAHIDATLLIMEPGYKALPVRHGELARQILETLRIAPSPMTAKDIAAAIEAEIGQVRDALTSQRRQGLVRGVKEAGSETLWEVKKANA